MCTDSASIRTRWAAIGAAVAVSLGALGLGGFNIVSAEISGGDRPVFVPINPCRLTDTRPDPNNVGGRKAAIAATETVTLRAHGSNGECTDASVIPTDAVALSLNVTALNATSQTFLTFWGTGDNPGTANLNPAPRQPPTPNAVNTPLSSAGTFNVYNDAGYVDIVIDVNGYYAPHNHDDRYYTQGEIDSLLTSPTQWASVSASGTLRSSSPGVTAGKYINPSARYVVDFGRDVSDCAYAATATADYTQEISIIAVSGAELDDSVDENDVYVYTQRDGAEVDTSFALTVNC